MTYPHPMDDTTGFADPDEIHIRRTEILRLVRNAESGEDWALIAKLEAEFIGAFGEDV